MTNRFFTNESFTLEKNPVTIYATMAFGATEVDTFTFAAKASTADGDYFVAYDTAGLSWAVALDTTGGAAQTPTGAVWAAIPSARKAYYDVSGATTGSDIATLVVTALGTLTGFPATPVASTTHVAITQAVPGLVTAPSVHSYNDGGAGSITVVVTTAGTAAITLTPNRCAGVVSAAFTAKGNIRVTFGETNTLGTAATTPPAKLDTYYKVLAVARLWDAIGNSGTAPLAPIMYVTANAIGTAGSASVDLKFTNSTGSPIATNPAAGERLKLEFQFGNSQTY